MKKADTVLIVLAGIITFLGGIVHFTFFPIFNSEAVRDCLKENWSLLHPLNLGSILFAFTVAYVSIFHTKELTGSKIGRPLLISFSFLFLIRMISEFVFMGYSGLGSVVWIMICLIPISIFLRAFIRNIRSDN